MDANIKNIKILFLLLMVLDKRFLQQEGSGSAAVRLGFITAFLQISIKNSYKLLQSTTELYKEHT